MDLPPEDQNGQVVACRLHIKTRGLIKGLRYFIILTWDKNSYIRYLPCLKFLMLRPLEIYTGVLFWS